MNPEITTNSESGNLTISVPHWLVQVRIYDQLSKLVETINEFDEIAAGHYFEAAIELVPGIYEIEYSLAEKVDRKLKIIRPGENTDRLETSSDRWKKLQIASSFPLEHSTEAEIKYADYAQYRSTIKTKQTASSESTSVFLSVKIPDQYAKEIFAGNTAINYQEVFDLKNDQGISVISFQDDIESSPEEACMVFNADLPHGFYILEWVSYAAVRPGEKQSKCYQPVFLHHNWTTQLFVTTHTALPQAFSLNLTRYGMSFKKDDETLIAAEAVLEIVSHESGRSVVNKKHMESLLTGEYQNPWLGILAAYALIPSDDLFFNENELPDESLFKQIKRFLNRELPDHPDVLALHLERGKEVDTPLQYPPLLKIGLRRVQMHAVSHESTIPCGGLTDRLINTTLINGPWVCWEKLYEFPETNGVIPPSDSLPDESSQALAVESVVFMGTGISPKLPVYKVSTGTESNSVTPSASQESGKISTLQEASLLNLSQELSKSGDYQQLPSQINITPNATLVDFLNKVEGKDISTATSLPLSRVNTSLRNIIGKNTQLLSGHEDLTEDEQQIITYAFKEESKKSGKYDQSNTSSAIESDSPAITATASKNLLEDNTHSISIEECVSKLHAEANRLLAAFEKESGNLINMQGKEFAERLTAIADELLRRADFTLKTDSDNKSSCVNGAFLYLISSAPNQPLTAYSRDRKEELEAKKLNQQLWEKAIVDAPEGTSTIAAPVQNKYFDLWNLKKVKLYNEEQKAFYGQINILRGVGALDCNQETIHEVQKHLSTLSLYAPLYSLNSSNKENSYEKRLEEIVLNLESTVNGV